MEPLIDKHASVFNYFSSMITNATSCPHIAAEDVALLDCSHVICASKAHGHAIHTESTVLETSKVIHCSIPSQLHHNLTRKTPGPVRQIHKKTMENLNHVHFLRARCVP